MDTAILCELPGYLRNLRKPICAVFENIEMETLRN